MDFKKENQIATTKKQRYLLGQIPKTVLEESKNPSRYK
jgi:hypothetical protein